MSWRDIKDYQYSAINEDSGEAVAFFLDEDDCDKFIVMFNSDVDNGHLSLYKGEYIDTSTEIQVQGS